MISSFLDKRLLTAPSTRKNYRINIQSYFTLINKDMNTYFPFDLIKVNEKGKKLKEPIKVFTTPLEDYNNDLREVYTILHARKKGDLSKRTFFNSVKQLFCTTDKRLKDLEFWDILKARIRGCEPGDKAILNAADIKTILSHGNACSRSLFLILASSGRRISEILALTPDDVNTNVKPTTINILKTKTKQKTLCYISDEATEAYKTWMKERDTYLEDAVKRAAYRSKDPNDPRCFPFTYSNAIAIWSTLLMKSHVVEIEHVEATEKRNAYRKIKRKTKGERVMAHPHCLRTFFRSYLGDADFSEYLMGHATVLTRAYRQMKQEDMSEKYSKLMPNVTIFSRAPDLSGINSQLDELKQEMQKKDKQITEMGNQILLLLSKKETEKRK